MDKTAKSKVDVLSCLCQVLMHKDEVVRYRAAQLLGSMADPRATDALIKALSDEDPGVRIYATESLHKIADPRASASLLNSLLRDPCLEVKLSAIDTLVLLREPQVVPWLKRLATTYDSKLTWDEDNDDHDGWDDWLDVQIKSVQGLATFGIKESIPTLLAILEDEDGQDMVETIVKALSRFGNTGVASLFGLLESGKDRVRRLAANALADSNATNARSYVERCLKNPSPDIRLIAARRLYTDDPQNTLLLDLLFDSDSQVRSESVQLVGQVWPKFLAPLLRDPSPLVRLSVLKEIGHLSDSSILLEDREVIANVRDALGSDNLDCALAAPKALASLLGPKAVPELSALVRDPEQLNAMREAALNALVSADPQAAGDVLIDVVGDPGHVLAHEALNLLLDLACQEIAWPNVFAATLLSALRGRVFGIVADGEIPKGAQTGALVRSLENEQDPTTSTLAAILASADTQVLSVEEPQSDEILSEQDTAIIALAKRKAEANTNGSDADLLARREDLQILAAQLLGALPFEEVVTALTEVLSMGSTKLQQAAAKSVERISLEMTLPETVVNSLWDHLEAEDRDVRLSVLRALTASPSETMVCKLSAREPDTDPFIRVETARLLWDQENSESSVLTLLSNAAPKVRLAAAQLIASVASHKKIPELINFGLSENGYHSKQAGRLLRTMNADAASAILLSMLSNDSRKDDWPGVMNILGELVCEPAH